MIEAKAKERDFKPQHGMIVKHFKWETVTENDVPNKYFYVIEDVAEHTETGEQMVVYRQLYYPFKPYVRPLDMFCEKVDKNKYPNIKQEYRFELL